MGNRILMEVNNPPKINNNIDVSDDSAQSTEEVMALKKGGGGIGNALARCCKKDATSQWKKGVIYSTTSADDTS